MKNFVAAHEFDHEATFVYNTKVKQLEDSDDDSVVFGPKLPITVDIRKNLARLIAYCLNKDLKMAFPLTVERIYSDYEPDGDQSTPSYTLVKYYGSEVQRDHARRYALKLVNKINFLNDEVIVHSEERPVLIPVATEVEPDEGYYTEFLCDLVEGGGEDWDMFKDNLGFGAARVGDELGFDDLKAFFYVTGMESWGGKEVANTFNMSGRMKVEYLEDSVWKVTKV